MNEGTPVCSLLDVKRTYQQAATYLEILQGASLNIVPGEIVALTGPSGSGKSTLLHIAGLLEWPDEGEVVVSGQSCGSMTDGQRTIIRRKQIGFVYQFHHLLPEFSALENIMLPQLISGVSRKEAMAWAEELAFSVGIIDRAEHRPTRLSGGEQQRVAIARALANKPNILLADEPTGNLDQKTAEGVFNLLIHLAKEANLGVLIATHNIELTKLVDRVLRLKAGLIFEGR